MRVNTLTFIRSRHPAARLTFAMLLPRLGEGSGLVSTTPNPSPVKREGLKDRNFPSLRGKGARVGGNSHQVELLLALLLAVILAGCGVTTTSDATSIPMFPTAI